MNTFIREIHEFYNNSIYYGDTDSLYIEKKHWDVLDKTKLVGEEICQGKNHYRTGCILYGLFLASKKEYCLTIDSSGIVQEHETFKGFNKSKRLLDRSQHFEKIEDKKISAMLPRSCKKSFNGGVIIPEKMRFCNECKDGILCTTCVNQINENKEFKANLNESKRLPLNEFCHMIPHYKLKTSTFGTNSSIM